MIVHTVKIGSKTSDPRPFREHKLIYVGCAVSDIRYRDMLMNGSHRWALYSEPTIDFITVDRDGKTWPQYRQIVADKIRDADGVMIIVSGNTLSDPLVQWEIRCAVSNDLPITGVDVGRCAKENIPNDLKGKMIRFGWEWFAKFFNGL
ncbi:MAG TPA: hypothetical protein DHV36_01740 [Desulfobacteraceae bacterium]|nr:hypothetical protein [Desulfobacteraceae bacterium]|tara:strand:- start:1508 stop:1951 length:444 start_codon:yes stop_codon:yes gene_type:complete